MEAFFSISILWLFPIAFAVSYLVTRKDLALACAVVSVIGVEAFHLDPEQWNREQILTVVIMCNLSLASISAVHYMNTKKPLARVMGWVASFALLINLIQAFEFYAWTADALLIAQMVAVLAIITLDGSKDIANDMAAKLTHFISSMGFGNSNHGSGES